jgi:hypothetical protein
MRDVNQPVDLRHLVYPQCPYNNSVLLLVLRVGLIVLGTVGIRYLHVWIAAVYLVYSVAFFFVAMPVKHCQYCYYKVREPAGEREKGKTRMKLLPVDTWKESYLQKHVDCGKKWGFNFAILWVGPIVLIGISLFLNFSVSALLFLIGFIGVLAVMVVYVRWRVCPTCAIMDECHAAF